MKTLFCAAGIALAALAFANSASAQYNESASFQYFYDQLAGDGTWIETDQYGPCWQPSVSDPNWRPYVNGYWADSDAGRLWVSNEPWGEITYHYGRWIQLADAGWCWVPGNEWAPAWV